MRDIERKKEKRKGGFRIVLRPQLRGAVVSCRRAGDGWMDGWTKACRNRLCLPFQTQCDYFYVIVGKLSWLSVSDLSLNDV